ncbi:sulfatase-like hydrolase/transferase [Nocardioides sp. MAH-18]|uniref:Sulfatase-like hydrolase/transferase n=1 Tax=Nocardioides agri TaxID=2682843 RepID=A0A6L6XSC9_9ACTN|nr:MULTISPECIES: arylsulfatase [unclassified Nocardioides]MBA2955451.1 sulfatase-like hydrolase/transferase [Nocardioides sp. CGMCC 1.13656]MVQ50301.1 sulfatase-like hydrolase/transferase [Nocardioides sp. MAH-18]
MDRTHLPFDGARPSYDPAVDVRDQDAALPARPLAQAPEGAPNVLLVLLDDMGFGASSAFGGPCRMPVAEALADNGLRYSRFHTTALCSPTRAALMTGRNHHAVGMGTVVEISTGRPGYDATRPLSAGTLAQTLSYNGYATGAFGKWHQTPSWEQTAAGPFDRWPTREGFDRFYGFLGGEASQFEPTLVEGTTFVDPPRTPEEGYHLSEDLVDRAIAWVREVRTHAPDKPWFCYLPFGATHAPFQVPEGWAERYRGEFAHGWDRQREITLERQKEIGVVPPEAQLAPWTPGVPHWDELSDDDRLVAERLMELYAAFAEHTDAQVGRLVEALRASGELDNTIVLYVLGDNGASAEGGIEGTLNETLRLNGIEDDTARIACRLDELGTPDSYAHYPAGWAVAMDTPYQWTKQVASHYGGTRNGLVVHWPDGIAGRGEVRHQWHHVVDVLPTLLEAAGLPLPVSIDGVEQQPLDGVSFRYSFNDAGAPERHVTQYFEMFGNRGIYHHGWTAVAKHKTPWATAQRDTPPMAEDRWELYDTRSDWTQTIDLAETHPERLAELQELFLAEARRNHVLPMDDQLSGRFDARTAGRPAPPRSIRLLPGAGRLREDAVPSLKNTSFAIRAALSSDASTEGVVVAQGGGFGGWALYVKDGLLTYAYNFGAVTVTHVRAGTPLAAGDHVVEVLFTYDGGGLGRGGDVRLVVDGEKVGAGRVERTLPFFYSMDQTLDVGLDRGTPVTSDYGRAARGFAFTGRIREVVIEAGDDALTPTDEQLLKATLVTH